ncbi:MAG: restriction endonuclease subunit S [Gammaproteobacteria bacterium]
MKNDSVMSLSELVDAGVVQLTRGKIISKKDIAAYPGSYPVYSSAKESDGKFGEYGRYLFDEELITWSVDGGGRLFHRPKHKFSVTNVGGVLRILNRSILDYRYLFYALTLRHSEIAFDWVKKAHPSVIRKLYTNISIPPLTEQLRIVGVLDEAFAGLATAQANAEENLQNARALFESHLQSVFTRRGKGWFVNKVSEIAKHSLGKMLDKAKNKGNLQLYLRNINVRWFTFDLSDLLEMPFLPNEADKYTAVKGDVLICEGGYPGRAAIWNEDYPIYFQKALHRVRFHQSECNKWFVYYLYAQYKSGELKQHFSGTGIQHFTGEVLARFEIPLPPLPELRRAVAKFDALSVETQRLEGLYQKKLTSLAALKKSLLHQAFSGQL